MGTQEMFATRWHERWHVNRTAEWLIIALMAGLIVLSVVRELAGMP